MFNFFNKKNTRVENFDDNVSKIRDLLSKSNFSGAEKIIYKVEKIEKKVLNDIIKNNLPDNADTEDIIKNYNEKINKLKDLKEEINDARKEKWYTWIFSFFIRKNVVAEKIKEFNEGIKAINIYILLSEWDKAKQAIDEIEKKEQESLDTLLEKLRKDESKESLKVKNELIKENWEKLKKLSIIKGKLRVKEEKYIKNEDKERFKIKFKLIKDEIDILTWNKKNTQALNLLQKFLEDYKDKSIVINFYNKEKKVILKNIEKAKVKYEVLIKQSARSEALNLIWQTVKNNDSELKDENSENKHSIFGFFMKKFNFYKKLKENIKNKRLLDDISMLIEENSKVKNDIAEKKLENIHKWLIKEISDDKIVGYELYWKILWADKISWDTFWLYDDDEKYVFFLWDATWHWIRAGLIVTLLSRLFSKYAKGNDIKSLVYEVNNWLKQDLQSRNFITWIFFEIIRSEVWKVNFVWMWHEPMLIYRTKTKKVDKIIPWWLAAWIRIIKEKINVKVHEIELDNEDILITYSDWVTDSKNFNWEYYWIEKLQESILKIAPFTKDINKIYEHIINDVKSFRWWTSFDDDVSILILKRNNAKDIQDVKSEYLKNLTMKEWLKNKDLKKLIWKNKEEIFIELEKIRKKKEIERIVKNLENLYYTWEILKLKQEAIRYIKADYIDKRINYYLKKAIDNETKYRIEQKNWKIVNKYNVLKELEKKWDYNTVITEIEEIIAKDWSI